MLWWRRRGLSSSDPSVRIEAIRRIAASGDRRLLDDLRVALGDRDTRVSAEAVRGLAALSGSAAFALHLLNSQTDVVRNAAIDVLRASGQHDEALQKHDEQRRFDAAMDALRKGDARLFVEMGEEGERALIAALKDPAVQSNAAYALGKMKSRVAIVPLIGLLNHGNESGRSAAAKAVGSFDLPAARAALRLALSRTESDWVRDAIVDALIDIGGDAAKDAVLSELARGHYTETLVRYSGRVRDQRAVPHLIAILADHKVFWQTRMRTAEALGEIGDPAAVPALASVLAESDVGAAAAEAIGICADSSIVSLVADLPPTRSWKFGRKNACKALALTADVHALSLLQTWMEEPETANAAYAALLDIARKKLADAAIGDVERLAGQKEVLARDVWEYSIIEPGYDTTRTETEVRTIDCAELRTLAAAEIARRGASR